MEKSPLEIFALVFSVGALVGWSVFWISQILDVIEMLEMAYG